MNAAEIVHALGGRGGLCRCLVDGHGRGRGDLRPSLSIADGDEPGKVLVKCFAGCDSRDVLDELRRRGFLDDYSAGPRRYRPPPPPPPAASPDMKALAIWREGEPIDGSLAERYLVEHRCLSPPFPITLRFARSVLYRPAGIRLPALLAAVSRPDRKIAAVQATFLRPSDGAKASIASPRWTFGPLGSGCVRLSPIAGGTLGLAEGTETALAAMQLSGIPCWATLGGGRLASVTLPPDVAELHIFADNDEPGRQAAEKAAERHARLGRKIFIRTPAERFGDWADVVVGLSREAAS